MQIHFTGEPFSKDQQPDCTDQDYPIGQQTTINSIFWGDITRSITHEKLEWWLAKAKKMSFLHLEEGIYQAGVAAGVYLSRYQRPINAVPNLRAKPVWEVKDTGLKKALDKIRENWKVIRDEGLELMNQRRKWRVDPGWVGLPDSRCVCNDFVLTSVCIFDFQGLVGGSCNQGCCSSHSCRTVKPLQECSLHLQVCISIVL